MYYIMLPTEQIDNYQVIQFKEKEQAFRYWQEHQGAVLTKDIKFKIVEEV